jgi:hypothetical protein
MKTIDLLKQELNYGLFKQTQEDENLFFRTRIEIQNGKTPSVESTYDFNKNYTTCLKVNSSERYSPTPLGDIERAIKIAKKMNFLNIEMKVNTYFFDIIEGISVKIFKENKMYKFHFTYDDKTLSPYLYEKNYRIGWEVTPDLTWEKVFSTKPSDIYKAFRICMQD